MSDKNDAQDSRVVPVAHKDEKKLPPHSCSDFKISDGGGIDPRYPGRTWVTRYRCSICGIHLGTEMEQLD